MALRLAEDAVDAQHVLEHLVEEHQRHVQLLLVKDLQARLDVRAQLLQNIKGPKTLMEQSLLMLNTINRLVGTSVHYLMNVRSSRETVLVDIDFVILSFKEWIRKGDLEKEA